MPAVQKRYRRRRRLRPQFVIFCLVVALLLLGIVLLLSRCSAKRQAEPAGAVQQVEEIKPKKAKQKNTKQREVMSEETVEETENGIPAGYIPATADIGAGTLILVSNDHDYTFPASVELVVSLEQRTAEKYLVRDFTVRQEKQTFAVFDRMLCDFADATGHTDVNITSAYRSYDEQQDVFNSSAAANGLEHAKRYVTHPGGSEHHTGLAADLNVYNVNNGTCYDFDGQGDYKWVYDHCAEYGIVLRYGADKESITNIAPESWHFRYVGVPHAKYMTENNLCLEEYIDLLRQYTVNSPLNYEGYTIYFCPQNALVVPEGGNYTISGNNVDGFIVTVG